MIFVTVGTHEQQFDRLISYIDELKGTNVIQEDVVMQIGFCTYEPKYCQWSKLLPHKEVKRLTEEARIVITHGGPASFIMPLQYGKVPVVVPRNKDFGEHVNNHQLEFCQKIVERQGTIIMVENIEELKDILLNYESLMAQRSNTITSNNAAFCEAFSKIVDDMFR